MKRFIINSALAITGAGLLTIGGASVVSAATPHESSTINGSGISRSAYHDELLQAQATVLKTSTTTVKADHKNKTFKTLLSQAGLTPKTFQKAVRAQVLSDFEAKGFSQSQITVAEQRMMIKHLRNELKAVKGTPKKMTTGSPATN